jgi:hypothetical protein
VDVVLSVVDIEIVVREIEVEVALTVVREIEVEVALAVVLVVVGVVAGPCVSVPGANGKSACGRIKGMDAPDGGSMDWK